MMRVRTILRTAAALALTALALIGCAQNGVQGGASGARNPDAPDDATPGALYSMFHRPLKSPEGVHELLRLHGKGVQIFRCEQQAAGPHWVYRLPEAELTDAAGTLAVRHGANLSFEHVDGSRLLGEIVDHVASPKDGSLPWLLLSTRTFGTGALSGVRYIQRIDTVGGMPPPACEAGQVNQVLRVPFLADFVFFGG